MKRHLLPALAAATLLATGPPRESFDLVQLPKELVLAALAVAVALGLARARPRLDPTDARTRLELLRAEVSARRCDEARRHLPALERQLPRSAAAKDAEAAFHAFCP